MKFPIKKSIHFLWVSAALIAATAAPVDAAPMSRTITNETQLQQAFSDAQANPGNSYSLYLNSGTYALTKTLTLTQGTVYMYGAGGLNGSSTANQAQNWVLDGRGLNRVIRVEGPTTSNRPYLFLRGISIRNGKYNEGGAGAFVRRGYLDLLYCIVAGNQAGQYGAGIYAHSSAVLTVKRSLVEDNFITNAYPSDNPFCPGGTTASGGGIAAGRTAEGEGISVDIIQTTIRRNLACRGGGVAVIGGGTAGPLASIYITNSTIGENTAANEGGGLFLTGTYAEVRILHSTISTNKAATHLKTGTYQKGGGGISFYGYKGNLRAGGMILANNQTVNPDTREGTYAHDCLRGTLITTTPGSALVNDNMVGRVDKCTFFGQPYNPSTGSGWYGIGSEAAPFDPGLQPILVIPPPLWDMQAPWGGVPVFLPSSSGQAYGNYSKYSSTGNTTIIGCPSVDQIEARRNSAPNYCSVGAVENPW